MDKDKGTKHVFAAKTHYFLFLKRFKMVRNKRLNDYFSA